MKPKFGSLVYHLMFKTNIFCLSLRKIHVYKYFKTVFHEFAIFEAYLILISLLKQFKKNWSTFDCDSHINCVHMKPNETKYDDK
jgi:hypothetical protein